jgi:hypothetical protein
MKFNFHRYKQVFYYMKGMWPVFSANHASDQLLSRYSLSGEDDHGYTMLHTAIRMAESLGLVNNHRKINLKESSLSDDMRRSLNRTAWGLFQVDTYVDDVYPLNQPRKSPNLSNRHLELCT